ncbi:MAG: type III secretion system export apparatus subunit SctU [Candidatus Eisenbacteria bacterium]
MAESGEKTEQPTPKRLREAREKGQVAKSQDLTSAVLFLVLAMLLLTSGAKVQEVLMTAMRDYFQQALAAPSLDVDGASVLLQEAIRILFRVIGPVLGVGFAIGAAVVFFQVGPLFSMQPLSPSLSKLDPLKGAKNKFFSTQTYLELAKSLLKIVIVSVVVYMVVKGAIRDVGLTVRQPVEASSNLTGHLLRSLTTKVGGMFLVLGTVDLFLQRAQHIKKLKMSKDEVKREYKQQEGDPQYKGHRKQMHQEILQHNMIEDVKNADVVIINPTHLAIALKYRKGEMGAPQIMAKGERLFAKQILEVARRYRVPVMRNVPLAHALFALEVGDQVPEELYTAVAEVLNWVYQQKQPTS